ncbi:ATF/CREB activator 1 [Bienertia sinuspersici]
MEKLPDASLLLSPPISSQSIGSDHSSRVAAAMVENASRKREANGSSSLNTRSKIPRGGLTHSKNIPDTSSGLLTPPQLRGR